MVTNYLGHRNPDPAHPPLSLLLPLLMNAKIQPLNPAPARLDPAALRRSAITVIETEARAISLLESRIDGAFLRACELMLDCGGRVVVSGMGKSGHVARKIAATLASTGTPAFFVHPGEASHGDLGMITQKDVVLALSNSGETDELLAILPLIKRQGVPLILMTGNPDSSLATMADVHLDVSVPEEACPLGLAPTASTTAALVMGDALAIALLEARGFTEEDFARSHPAGALGRRLFVHVADVMHSLGMTAVVGADGALAGVFTDGDLRRAIDDDDIDLRRTRVTELMSTKPKTIRADKLAVEAAQLMETYKIHALLVVDTDERLIGALNIHDLFRARVV